MIGKKINQLATELAPVSTDLTIIGDPTTGVSKKITLAQLGAIFSGAVSFYTDLASFPATGDINVIYCAKDTQKLYLWSGSAYVEVFPSQALLNTYQLRSEKGVSNGYASLDSGGKVPISQLPSSIMEYKGTWNAATNTPTLANGTGDTGDVYICNVAGTVNFGAGPLTFAVGDYVIYSGSIWQRSSGAVGTVTSVAATITGDSLTISGSPVTTSGTLAFAFNGTTAQYIRGNGTLETFPTSLISGTGNVNAIPKFTANTVLGNSSMEDDGSFVSMRGLKLNLIAGTGNSINFQQASGIIAAGLGYSSIGAAGSTGIKFYLDQNSTTRSFVLDTTTITSDTERTYSMPNSSGTLALTSQIPSLTGYVPYTGATANLDLGTHTLIAAKGTFSSSGSGDTVGITHSSGSGIALNITKGGSGEGLYINKTSGSGNAATIIGTLNATTLVKSGGTSSQFLKADGSVDSTSYGTGSVTSVGLSSATSGVTIGSTPITTSGTITLAIATASGSQQGLLSSTDWTTFNNKQSALTNPVTGTGTTNYLPKFTGASTIGDSSISDVASSPLSIVKNASSITSNLIFISPTTGTNASILQLDNAGAGSFYIGRQNSAGNSVLLSGLGSYASVVGHTGSQTLHLVTNALSRVQIDGSGNLGLGVTPSAWGNSAIALQIRNGSIWNYNNSDNLIIASNNYFDVTNAAYRYVITGFASEYTQDQGKHIWKTAPSGTAGNAISFTQAMTLNASGRLILNTTDDNAIGRLQVRGNGTFTGTGYDTINSPEVQLINTTSSTGRTFVLNSLNSGGFQIADKTAGGATRLLINSTGAATFSSSVTTGNNITVNSSTYNWYSSSSAAFRVVDFGQYGSVYSYQDGAYYSGFTNNAYFASGTFDWRYKNTGGASNLFFQDGNLYFETAASGTAGNAMSLSTKFYISQAGNVGIGTTSPANKLDVVGDGIRTSADQSTSAFLVLAGSSSEGRITVSSYGGYQPMTFYTGGSERMRITSGGDIGIGNTGDASVRLFVSGKDTSSNNYAALFRNSSGSNLLGVKNSGTVNMGSLPTSSSGLSSGDIYVAAGVLMIV